MSPQFYPPTPKAVVQGRMPSSVQVGSGSYAIQADGTVIFAGCSSVSLNGVFDGIAPDVYDIVGSFDSSTGATVTTRWRAAGSDDTAANKTYTADSLTLSAGPGRLTGTTTANIGFWIPTGAGAANIRGKMRVFGPGLSVPTWSILESISSPAGDRYYWREAANDNGGVRDGLTLMPSAGTISGSVKVIKLA